MLSTVDSRPPSSMCMNVLFFSPKYALRLRCLGLYDGWLAMCSAFGLTRPHFLRATNTDKPHGIMNAIGAAARREQHWTCTVARLVLFFAGPFGSACL
jgi:hypothetical protein